MTIYNFVAYLGNLVYENHDISLKNLSCICEVSDIAESVNSHYFLTWNDNIDKVRIFNNFANDLCTCLSESNSK